MPANAKCLIFGAAGFIGTHLTRHLRERGKYEIVSPSKGDVDIRDDRAVADYVRTISPSVILNLAAISTVHHGDDRALYVVNAIGHANVVEAAALLVRRTRLILASSAQVYGIQARRAVHEAEPTNPINHYGVSKVLAERLSRLSAPDVVASSVRMFNVVGREQAQNFLIPKIVRHFRDRADVIELGSDFDRDFVDIRDACEMWRLMIDAESPPPTANIANGEAISLATILALLTEITGHRIEVRRRADLVRSNEILYQCGDNSIIKQLGYRRRYELRQTLEWMLLAG
jgi:nucleoside-diphosphate-sugar epimerase